MKYKQIILGLVASLWLYACGQEPPFKSGEKVWIDLPVQSVNWKLGNPPEFGEGYAEGYVVELKGNMVQVQLTAVETRGDENLTQAMRPGTAPYIPLDQLRRWEAGKQTHEERRQIYSALREAILKQTNPPWEPAPLDEAVLAQTKKHQMKEVLLVLEALAAWHEFITKGRAAEADNAPLKTRCQILIDFITQLQSIVAKSPDGLESAHQAAVAVNQADVLSRVPFGGKSEIKGAKSIAGTLAGVWVASIYKVRDQQFLSYSKSLPEAVDELEGMRRLDWVFYAFVTDNGRLDLPQFNNQGLDAFLRDRWNARRQQLVTTYRKKLLEDVRGRSTREEAEAAFAAALAQAEELEPRIGEPLLGEEDQRAFLQTVNTRWSGGPARK